MQTSTRTGSIARVLLVDDEPNVTESVQRSLRKEPFEFESAESGREALELLASRPFDVVVSDERMPGMQGSEFLSLVRQQYPDIVRIILSGQASLEAAVRAINSAEIYRFLIKPCPAEEIGLTIREALRTREEKKRFDSWRAAQDASEPTERAARFERVMAGVWIGFQPICTAATGEVHGYEALLRSDDPDWNGPVEFFSSGKMLGRARELARRVRQLVAARIADAPPDATLFVNASSSDLNDERFVTGQDDLAPFAERVVIEITERDSVEVLDDFEEKAQRLREVGYRVALDDLGAGSAGLTSMALIVPDIVKFDMDLVRGIDRSPTKQKLVGPIVQMCRDLGIETLAEGVETSAERDTVARLGCMYIQGFLIGPATRDFACLPAPSH